MRRRQKRVAIFIDGANFERSLKLLGLFADYKKLLTYCQSFGQIVIQRYYTCLFPRSQQEKFFTFLKYRGFKLITKDIKKIKSRKKIKTKANFDVEITFDAALLINNFDIFILFSGDSDFVYLASQLKKRKKKVIVISPYFRTAKELRIIADQFIDLRHCDFAIKKPRKTGRSQL